MCDLQLRGALFVSTVAEAAAETYKVARRAHALVDDLEAAIGRDRYVELDNAIVDLEATIEREVSARLVDMLVAINHGDMGVFVAPKAAHGRPS